MTVPMLGVGWERVMEAAPKGAGSQPSPLRQWTHLGAKPAWAGTAQPPVLGGGHQRVRPTVAAGDKYWVDLSDFQTNAAVADEVAEPIKHRLAADFELLARAVIIDAAEREIQERLPGRDLGPKFISLGRIPSIGFFGVIALDQGSDTDAQHLLHRAGNLGEVSGLVLLPVPV